MKISSDFYGADIDVGVKEEKIGAKRSVAGTRGYSREH